MADNFPITPGSGRNAATDQVTYSGDTADVQLMRVVHVSGTEGAKTVDQISDPVYGLDVDVSRLPSALLDTFGKVQTAGAFNDVDVQFFRDVPANLVTVTTANGATATQTSGLMQLASSTATNGSVSAKSRDRVQYHAGGETFCLVTTAFLDGAVSGAVQRAGLFDASNGVFLGYEGTAFGLTVRSGAADTQTAIGSFSHDTLSGATGSKFTRGGTPEAIDLTKLNVWRIRFGWLGAAPITLEVLSPDGEWVLCHKVRYPNSASVPSIQSVDLPVTCEVTKTSGATNVRLNSACWGAGTTYGHVEVVGSNTLGTAVNSEAQYNGAGVGTMNLRVGTSTTGTIIIEGSTDGANWVTHPAVFLINAAGTSDTPVTGAFTPTSGNTYRIHCGAFRSIRVRTATTLGATVVLYANGEAGVSTVYVPNTVRTAKDQLRIAVQSAGLTTVTTTYTAGDQVGNLFTFANAARITGGTGRVTGIALTDANNVIGAFDVVLFRDSVTLAADNAAFAISDADMRKVVTLVPLAGAYALTNNRLAVAQNINIPYDCVATSLYAALICRTSVAVFGAVTDLELVLHVERD